MKKVSRGRALSVVGCATLLTALVGCGTVGEAASPTQAVSSKSAASLTMVTVVKLVGVGWFDRMDEGIKEWAASTGIDARMEGPDEATAEKQIQIIQNLLAQKPSAITVVPNSPEALENVLGEARKAGIVVVAHEGVGMTNVDADIEAFDNLAYGAQIMDNLATCMGKKGEYVSFVGSLTAKTHMDWVTGAVDRQKAAYPDMTRVEDPIESKEDENVAYERTKELLAKHPKIKGFQGSSSVDVLGIGRAVEEAGMADSTCVMGTSIPSISRKYIEKGSVDKIFFWDPAAAGKAQLEIARILVEGGKLADGTDLKIPGYESLKKLAGYDNVYVGNAAVIVDAKNVNDFNF